jgi:hypothetical protein
MRSRNQHRSCWPPAEDNNSIGDVTSAHEIQVSIAASATSNLVDHRHIGVKR